MKRELIEKAARQLIAAREGEKLLEELSGDAQPSTIEAAHAIQDAMVNLLGDQVAGWKVAKTPAGEFARGVILASRVFNGPAKLPAALCPMKVVEVEIAFRFGHDLPAQSRDYDYEAVANAVVPFAAIEVVDSRFVSYAGTDWMHRAADFMSNGAFVIGESVTDWRGIDLSTLDVCLSLNDEVKLNKTGGHPTIDPMLPVVALVNAFRKREGVKTGQFVTTGSFTGMTTAQAGQQVKGTFGHFGSVTVEFV
jgi:2-keto-4-pentenoate hydratase